MKNTTNLNEIFDAFAEVIADKVLLRLGNGAVGSSRTEPRLLSVGEAAARLGRSRMGVYHMINAGYLPSVRSDRRVFVDARDLERFIQDNKVSNN